ncbi:phosphatase PAP2 family protein [Companilactobacillus jidongensis]|uniref:phosphatase PAP2 family protein n=1 Tax=Companilactobacillus jidongensis TaxID=2486006 RepID=UPI000F7998F5|nr:phosphatase PAP2 family protein [Companilactobacillus jidongensis]
MIFSKNSYRHWLAIAYMAIFLGLEFLVVTSNSWLLNSDFGIQSTIEPMVNSTYTAIFTVISFIGSPPVTIIITLILAFWLFSKNKKVESIWTACTLMGGNVIAFLVKISVKRPRPVNKVIPDSGYSFPSGHVFGTTLLVLFVIYMVLPYFKNQETQFFLGTVAISWLIIMIFARLYLRGHFASDTVGSVILAGAWWEVAQLLYLKFYERTAELITHIPILRKDFDK